MPELLSPEEHEKRIAEEKAKEALVGAVDKGRLTPLHFAAREGHTAAMAPLLEAGTDVRAVDALGHTAAHAAAEAGKAQALAWLLERGADADAPNKVGRTLAHLAANRGFVSVVRAVVATTPKAVWDRPDQRGVTPLALALTLGKDEVAAEFLRAGAEASAKIPPGKTMSVLELIVGSSSHVLPLRALWSRDADAQAEIRRTADWMNRRKDLEKLLGLRIGVSHDEEL